MSGKSNNLNGTPPTEVVAPITSCTVFRIVVLKRWTITASHSSARKILVLTSFRPHVAEIVWGKFWDDARSRKLITIQPNKNSFLYPAPKFKEISFSFFFLKMLCSTFYYTCKDRFLAEGAVFN